MQSRDIAIEANQFNRFVYYLQEYDSDEASPNYAEVERFQGKLVYNHDGKAYIIDAENESPLQMSDSSSIKGEYQSFWRAMKIGI